MKSIKCSIVLGLSLLLFAMMDVAIAAPKGLIVRNNTGKGLCLAFVRTKTTATLKLSGDKGKKYEVLYEEGAINAKNDFIMPGQQTTFSGYESGGLKYDRVLWVIQEEGASCALLADITTEKKKPGNAKAFYIGSANDVTIEGGVGRQSPLTLRPTNAKTKQESEILSKALREAAQKAGVTWTELKGSATESWTKVQKFFKDAYAKAQKAAKNASKKVSSAYQDARKKVGDAYASYKKSKGEGREGEGEEVREGFAVDEPEGVPSKSAEELYMMP